MHLAVEIGQAEIRRVERSEYALSLRRGFAEGPCVMLLVGHDGLSEQARQRCEIVTPARDELAFVRYRHADVGLAESLRLELPSADALEVVATEPQSAAGRIRIDASRHPFTKYNVDSHL